jgi:hypothetical protein
MLTRERRGGKRLQDSASFETALRASPRSRETHSLILADETYSLAHETHTFVGTTM